MQYGQFCPVSKAAEVLGDRWSLLIIREMLMGGKRFNELQRGLSSISPTMLTKRLNELCITGLVMKKRISGQKGYEYFLTQSGRELRPVLEQLGAWGMRWARENVPDADLDVELLMLYLERSIDTGQLVGGESVFRIHFTDLDLLNDWWIIVKGDDVDSCIQDPGKDVDLYITTDLRTMVEAWMGDISYKQAIKSQSMKLIGDRNMVRDFPHLFRTSVFAGIAPATDIAS